MGPSLWDVWWVNWGVDQGILFQCLVHRSWIKVLGSGKRFHHHSGLLSEDSSDESCLIQLHMMTDLGHLILFLAHWGLILLFPPQRCLLERGNYLLRSRHLHWSCTQIFTHWPTQDSSTLAKQGFLLIWWLEPK